MKVDEHPQQHLLRLAVHVRSVATEHAGDLVGIVTHTELVQSFAESLEPLGAGEVDPPNRQHAIDRCVERDELEVRQTIDKAPEGDRSVISLERLQCPLPRHASPKLLGRNSIQRRLAARERCRTREHQVRSEVDTVHLAMALFDPLARLVLTRFRWFFATGDTRDAEILALRHQGVVLHRQSGRPQFTETDRTILAMFAPVFDRRRLADVLLIVKPATALGWHRRLVARHWTQPTAHKPSRPPVDPEPRRLVVRIARENPTWGYRRLHGELCRLGHSIAATSVWNILRQAGITTNQTRPDRGPPKPPATSS